MGNKMKPVPLPPLLFDIDIDNFIIIIRNNVIQECEQLLQLFQLPILVFIKAFQLFLELLANRCFELGKGVPGSRVTRWTTLFRGNIRI